jgi:large conductance mechanosensitive channel
MASGYNQARGFLDDFKDFLMKGNVVDLAVAVVIGEAFGKVVTSLMENIITPALLDPALKATNAENLEKLVFPGTAIKYGSFLSSIITFVVISFVIFVLIRSIEAAKRKTARQEALAETSADPAVAAQENLIHSLDRLTRAVESQNR